MRTVLRPSLQHDHCSVGGGQPLHVATVVFVCITAALIALAIVGTCYDVRSEKCDVFKPEKKKGVGRQLIESFSVRQNLRCLLQAKSSNENLNLFFFLRTFCLMCIMAGHRFLLYCGFPMFNGEAEDKMFRNPASMLVANGVMFVDVFFTIGGLTLTHILFEKFKKGATVGKLFLEIINRYLRLTPLYLMVILLHMGVLPYLGSGPLWKSTVVQEQTRCEISWWANILYINNYVDPSNLCVFQSWYLAADFHFFIICIFIGYVIWRWPIVGWTIMGTATLLSIVLPFMTIYVQNLEALVMPFPKSLKDFRENIVYRKLYITSHNRASPYLIGAMGGIVLQQGWLRFKLPNKTWTYLVFAISWLVAISIFFSAYVFFIPGRPYNKLETATYGALQHASLSVLVCLYGSIAVAGRSETLTNFLSAKVFMILSRLSYAAYLIHTVPQLYDQGTLRQPRHVDAYSALWLVVADLTITYALAVVLTVLVELPFRVFTKLLFQRGR